MGTQGRYGPRRRAWNHRYTYEILTVWMLRVIPYGVRSEWDRLFGPARVSSYAASRFRMTPDENCGDWQPNEPTGQ